MRILHVAESALGGVGSYLAELVPLQRAALGGDQVRVVVPDLHAHQLALSHDTLLPYPRSGRNPGSLLALMRAVQGEIARARPDVIHVHSTFAGLAVRGVYGWRPRRSRIVYCPHGWAFDRAGPSWKQRLAAQMERSLALFCDRVIAISRHEAAAARRIGIDDAKVSIVMNGITDHSPAAAASWDDDRMKILFVGRLDRQKGIDTLMDAIVPLRDRVSVRIIGQSVADLPARMGGDPGVEQLGWLPREAIEQQLAAADLMVIPSRWEGFGLVALEAMRAGKMVIASRVGGLKEVVCHDVSGWLVPPDDPAALGQRIARSSPRLRQRMGRNGRARFLTHFTAQRMHTEILDIYDRTLGARSSLRLAA